MSIYAYSHKCVQHQHFAIVIIIQAYLAAILLYRKTAKVIYTAV